MGVIRRNGQYWIDYYDGDGRRHRKKIGPQKNVAKNALKDVQVKIAKGEYLGIYEERKTPFKVFAEKYLKKIGLSVKDFFQLLTLLDDPLIKDNLPKQKDLNETSLHHRLGHFEATGALKRKYEIRQNSRGDKISTKVFYFEEKVLKEGLDWFRKGNAYMKFDFQKELGFFSKEIKVA